MIGLSANTQFVLLGSLLIGASAGLIGTFALLRRRALLGDAVAHAALPGVCLAFLLTGSKHPAVFVAGAAASSFIGSLSLNAITHHSRIKEDAAIGLVLSVFFGIGIMLLTFIQHQPLGNQSGLDRFLFGQAASLIWHDVLVFGGLALGLIVALLLFYKEFKAISFDAEFAAIGGIPVKKMDTVLTLLIVLVTITGLQAVGVVLMAALLITPAAAARYWTDRLSMMLLLAALFGAVSGIGGVLVSSLITRMPTGPWIVVTCTLIFGVSLILAPGRGMLARWWRHRRLVRRTNLENVLKTLYRAREDQVETTNSINYIRRFRPIPIGRLYRILKRLENKGWIRSGTTPDDWMLTPAGTEAAKQLVRRHRLWEVYLTKYLNLSRHQVHSDAEAIEHILTPELERELEQLLDYPQKDPHDRAIPYPTGGPLP